MMPAGQQLPHQAPPSANGESTPRDLFALTDEQILEIEPEGEVNVAPPGARPDGVGRAASSQTQPHGAPPSADVAHSPSVILSEPQASEGSQLNTNRGPSELEMPRSATAQAGVPVLLEPPAWLAAQMKDPWTGAEAKEFWNGVQQAKQEAAAYRAAFATPEDARALKEMYPGGVNEARAAANRAQLLDQIDQAYFGVAGSTPEQTSAARAQLAALMLREDSAAFREMVFAGLRALEAAEKGISAAANAPSLPRLAQIFAPNRSDAQSAVGATLGSPAADGGPNSMGGASLPRQASPAPMPPSAVAADFNPPPDASLVRARHAVPASGNTPADSGHVAAYAAFEQAANQDLERSVGAAIAHTIQQALPNLKERGEKAAEGARHGAPLQHRLSLAVRQDVEAALKGDRQLGEQIAQILSAGRFDNETRAQVVRLIDDRARQLVPGAARRVINDWTHATLAAHRGNATRADAASARTEVATASVGQGNVAQGESLPVRQSGASPGGRNVASTGRQQNTRGPSPRATNRAQAIDYRKLSDEQILEL